MNDERESSENDQFVKMRTSKVEDLFGISQATVYRWVKKKGWMQEQDIEGRSWTWVPKEFIKQYSHDEKQDEKSQESQVSQRESEVSQKTSNDYLMQLVDSLKEQYENRLKDKDKVIEMLQEDKRILTQDLAARNTAIQKFKEEKSGAWWKFWKS